MLLSWPRDHAEIDSNPSATYSELHMAQEVSVLRLRSSQRGRRRGRWTRHSSEGATWLGARRFCSARASGARCLKACRNRQQSLGHLLGAAHGTGGERASAPVIAAGKNREDAVSVQVVEVEKGLDVERVHVMLLSWPRRGGGGARRPCRNRQQSLGHLLGAAHGTGGERASAPVIAAGAEARSPPVPCAAPSRWPRDCCRFRHGRRALLRADPTPSPRP
jgi:hypothetical protein